MTTHLAAPSTRHDAPAPWPLVAALSIGTSAVLTAIGTFWSPLANYEATRSLDDLWSWLVCVAITAVAAAVVFGLVARRATVDNAPRRAVVLAVVGVLSLAVFWTGLPMVMVGGAVCCALEDVRRTPSRVALVLSVLIAGVAVWAALAG